MVEGQSSKWWVLEVAKVLRAGAIRSLETSWKGSLPKPESVTMSLVPCDKMWTLPATVMALGCKLSTADLLLVP